MNHGGQVLEVVDDQLPWAASKHTFYFYLLDRSGLPMRLTLHTDYSLRVLMFAALKGEALSTIAEIADHFDISRTHLMKIVNDLGRAGYLDTVRGNKGGFRLAKKPIQIRVGDVVRDLEEELAVVGCMQQSDYCPIEGACILRRALAGATAAFLAVLDGYTLHDLVKPRKPLAQLLNLGALPVR